jgi:hypothetical protein
LPNAPLASNGDSRDFHSIPNLNQSSLFGGNYRPFAHQSKAFPEIGAAIIARITQVFSA